MKALIVKTKQEFEVKEEKVEKLELKIEYEKCCVGWSNELKEKVGELMNSGCKSKIEMDSGREILEYM